jgi:hypothetical protein
MLLLIVLVIVGLAASVTATEGTRRARTGREMERAANALRPAALLMDPMAFPSEDVRVIASRERSRVVVPASAARRYRAPEHVVVRKAS